MASSDRQVVQVTKKLVFALGEGMLWANGEANRAGSPVYCQPENLALGEDNYVDILNRVIRTVSNPANQAEVDDYPVGGLLIQGLKMTFPCAKKP